MTQPLERLADGLASGEAGESLVGVLGDGIVQIGLAERLRHRRLRTGYSTEKG
jgi:hypothetical protein